MIRMSLDKETVLPRDVRGDAAVPEGPASGGGGGVDRVRGVMMSPPCLGPTGFTGSMVLTEQPHPHGPKTRSTHPLKTKNGLHPPNNNPQVFPPGQQQRMGKRRYSLGGSFKHPGFGKRRRRANSDSQSDPVLPSNFLLGGNIFDPLNLNSLLDEEVSRELNAETPKSSPLPARARDPVEILVPRDITDPLNLKSGGGEGEEGGGVLVSPMKNRKRHRNRHHGGGGVGAQPEPPVQAVGSKVEAGGDSGTGGEVLALFPASVSVTGELAAVPEAPREGQSPLPYELNTTINCRDEVVPPILPRRHTHPPLGSTSKPRPHGDGGHRQRKRRRTTSTRSDHSSVTPTPATAPPNTFHTPLVPGSGLRGQRSGLAVGGQQQPQNSFRHKSQKKKNRFQHGNYSRYYGYHGYYGYRDGQVGQFEDPRLGLLRPDWFRGKTVLDIGCSTGHLTLAIARHFNPAHILGIDVDGQLVHAARQNIRHFLSERLTQYARGCVGVPSLLPPSPPPSPLAHGTPGTFPNNVSFITGDYMEDREPCPHGGDVTAGYDVILCLGVTKWVQLHGGDGGVVRMFRQIYTHLRPGGMLLLEPQPWSSYCRSKNTTETTYKNYCDIRLRPDNFCCYLTSTVGFTCYRLLTDTGFQRPIYLFHKGPAPRK